MPSISPKRSKQLVYVNTNLQKILKGAKSFRSKFKIPKGANSYGDQILSLKNRKTATLNSQNIRMLRTHVNNDIYNIYCLIHNTGQQSNQVLRNNREYVGIKSSSQAKGTKSKFVSYVRTKRTYYPWLAKMIPSLSCQILESQMPLEEETKIAVLVKLSFMSTFQLEVKKNAYCC